MVEIKRITQRELQDISGITGFNLLSTVKDYYVTIIQCRLGSKRETYPNLWKRSVL